MLELDGSYSFKAPDVRNLDRGIFLCFIGFFQALQALFPPKLQTPGGLSLFHCTGYTSIPLLGFSLWRFSK